MTIIQHLADHRLTSDIGPELDTTPGLDKGVAS
jgi:hypothetical protein